MKIFLSFFLFFSFFSFAVAQDCECPETASSPIESRAQELREFSNLLESDDRFILRATIEEAFKTDDSTLHEMAREAGLTSDDPDIQMLVLKEWLMRRSRLGVDLILPENPSDEQIAFYNAVAPLWFVIRNIDPSANELYLQRGGISYVHNFSGSLVPGGFNIYYRDEVLSLKVGENGMLVGTYGKGGSVAVTARVAVR
jgi:hypothetical protein